MYTPRFHGGKGGIRVGGEEDHLHDTKLSRSIEKRSRCRITDRGLTIREVRDPRISETAAFQVLRHVVFVPEQFPALRTRNGRHLSALVTQVSVQRALLIVDLAAGANVLLRGYRERRGQVVALEREPRVFRVKQAHLI